MIGELEIPNAQSGLNRKRGRFFRQHSIGSELILSKKFFAFHAHASRDACAPVFLHKAVDLLADRHRDVEFRIDTAEGFAGLVAVFVEDQERRNLIDTELL